MLFKRLLKLDNIYIEFSVDFSDRRVQIMRLVPIECVREGSFLAKTIFDENERVLLREGVILTENLINRIKLIPLYSIYINDEYSDTVIDDIIKPELRQKCISTLKDTFKSIEKYSSQNTGNKSKVMGSFLCINDLAQEIMDEILNSKNLMINLVDIKNSDNYTYQHSVNVAVLSLVLGTQLSLRRSELLDLCTGALIHDIGKVFIPKEILNKPSTLTTAEFSLIAEHTLKGYNYLKDSSDISSVPRIIVLQHHEKVNGRGYPENRESDKINKLAKITAICDVYDALTSDRPYRRAMLPSDALEYIMAHGGTHFDYDMVKAFSKIIVPYPQGTIVKLSNDDIGIVQETYVNFPLRPQVKILRSKNPTMINQCINLTESLSIVIKNIEFEISS